MSRKRIFNAHSTTGSYRRYVNNEMASSWFSDEQKNFISGEVYRYMVDVVTPGFKKLSAQGQIINSPMLKVDMWSETVPVLFNSRGDSEPRSPGKFCYYEDGYILAMYPWNETNLLTVHPQLKPEIDHDLLVAAQKLHADVDMNAIQGMVSTGELPETVRWMASLLQRLISLIKTLKSKEAFLKGLKFAASFNRKRDIAKEIASLWLEFRYALRPLVGELKSLTEAIKAVKPDYNRVTSRSIYTSSWTDSTSGEVDAPWGLTGSTIPYTVTWNRNSTYRSGILHQLELSRWWVPTWGLDQLLETAWELTTLSFVVDRFISVGTWLGSLSPKTSLSQLANWITADHLIECRISAEEVNYASSYPYICQYQCESTPGHSVKTVHIRERIPNVARPDLPLVNMNLDASFLLDLVALVYQLFFGVTKGFKIPKIDRNTYTE